MDGGGAARSGELRRSCVFCRQRKMKCSGDLPCCQTCRQREKACMYEPVMAKGRVRRVDSISEPGGGGGDGVDGNRVLLADTAGISPVGQLGGVERNNSPSLGGEVLSTAASTVGEELAVLYVDFCNALAADRYNGAIPVSAKPPLLEYGTALTAVGRDLIDMSLRKIHQTAHCDRSAARFMLHLLADQTDSLHFGLDGPTTDRYFSVHGMPSTGQMEQMVELAYNNNPLVSLIIPKTPFMRDLREGSPTPCLMWLLCAEGLDAGVPISVPEAMTTYTLPSSRIMCQVAWRNLFCARYTGQLDSLWIAQGLLLFGFRLLCASQCKQAVPTLLLCNQLIRQIIAESRVSQLSEVKMNGVRICEVEGQAIANVFWLAYVLLLWCWMQVETTKGKLHQFLRPDNNVLTEQPINSFPHSPMYRLEFVSGNLTSLHTILANSRTLSVLVHMAGILQTISYGDRRVWPHLYSDYSPISVKLIEQTATSVASIGDELARKSIMASAYVFAISVCDAEQNSSQRCEIALHVLQGMLRDCVSYSNVWLCNHGALLTHMYCTAHSVFVRIMGQMRRELCAHSVNNSAFDSMRYSCLQKAHYLSSEFGRLTLNGLGATMHGPIPPTPILPTPVKTETAYLSVHNAEISGATTAAPHVTISAWEMDGSATPYRARSYSDSAAIYCPASSSLDINGADAAHPFVHTGLDTMQSASSSSLLPSVFSPTFAGPPHEPMFLVDEKLNSTLRPRTASLSLLPSEGPHPYGQQHTDKPFSPPSPPHVQPPQSAPPSHLALLSETATYSIHPLISSFSSGGDSGENAHAEASLHRQGSLASCQPFVSATEQEYHDDKLSPF